MLISRVSPKHEVQSAVLYFPNHKYNFDMVKYGMINFWTNGGIPRCGSKGQISGIQVAQIVLQQPRDMLIPIKPNLQVRIRARISVHIQ
jgi:hypothetical protein